MERPPLRLGEGGGEEEEKEEKKEMKAVKKTDWEKGDDRKWARKERG